MTIEQQNEHYTWYGENLLKWYFQIERDLPWRKNHDPYRIWVSEIMLQQTQVKTVIPYFERFMSHFPTVEALAAAHEEEVLKCWEGLGYYSRARNLQAGAKMVVAQYGGVMPNEHHEVAKIKGVGPYTSGAIMSIAFNYPISAVDGNVMRVLSRFLRLEDDIAKVTTRKKIEKIATDMIPHNQARYFNQALMELGALVCTPKSPLCHECPVAEKCLARQNGLEKILPIKTKAKKARVEHRVALIISKHTDQGLEIFIRQRAAEGLLASMWELPHIQLTADLEPFFTEFAIKEQEALITPILQDVDDTHRLLAKPKAWYSDMDHVFSHIHWKMRFYEADYVPSHEVEDLDLSKGSLVVKSVAEGIENYTYSSNRRDDSIKNGIFITKEDMSNYPFPNLFLKVLEKFFAERG